MIIIVHAITPPFIWRADLWNQGVPFDNLNPPDPERICSMVLRTVPSLSLSLCRSKWGGITHALNTTSFQSKTNSSSYLHDTHMGYCHMRSDPINPCWTFWECSWKFPGVFSESSRKLCSCAINSPERVSFAQGMHIYLRHMGKVHGQWLYLCGCRGTA